MQETRQNRIARLLQKELSLIFQSQTRAMHGVMVSVTRCRVSPDLSILTAYLSVFPSEKADEILRNITANEKTIRYELGTRVATSCVSSPNCASSWTTRSIILSASTSCSRNKQSNRR